MKETIETGSMLAESGPEMDRVFLRLIRTPPWWAFWRTRVTTVLMTTGQARTVAVGLGGAVHKLETKRKTERRIILP